jgi:hypothetical protein
MVHPDLHEKSTYRCITRQSWCYTLAIVVSLFADTVMAEVSWLTDFPAVNATWTSGNISTTVNANLRSVDSGGGRQRYGVKAKDSSGLSSVGDQFQLTNLLGEAVTITRVRYRNANLVEDTFSGTWRGDTSQSVPLRFRFNSADLSGARPGVYQGTITLCAAINEAATASDCTAGGVDSDKTDIDVTLTIAGGLVSVSGLSSTIPMTHNLGSGAAADEMFCIGTNGSGVRLTLTSSYPDGLLFRLKNDDAPPLDEYIPYSVTLAGISLGQAVPESIAASNTQISDLTCAFDITHLVATATEMAVNSVPPGAYKDTLTLLVEPQ